MRGAWRWIYGGTLVLIGVLLGIFVVHQVMNPLAHEGLWTMVLRLALASFVSIGAVAVGVERILRREFRRLKPMIRPDEWLVEKFGPKAIERWRQSKSGPN